ncbi:MAG: hypothetical protein ACREAC_04310, partial [Blastocatellia bacterium]
REDAVRARDAFLTAFASIGGWAKPMPARVAFEIAYERLNPERAVRHRAPSYSGARIPASPASTQPAPSSDNGKSNQAAVPLISLELDDSSFDRSVDIAFGQLTSPPNGNGKKQTPVRWVSSEEHFADSPRETLCLTPIRVRSDHFIIGDLPVMTISLHKLPAKTFAGLMEVLTRQAELKFPYDLSSTFWLGDQQKWDDKLGRMLHWARVNVTRARTHDRPPNQDEEVRDSEVYALRDTLKRGVDKIGEVAWTITFSAPTEAELLRRRDTLLVKIRLMESMEGVAEPSLPLDQFIASLPCAGQNDFRRIPVLSHTAVAMLPLTGAACGASEEEAIDVLQRADLGLFFWHPRDKRFRSGMALFCGPTGSGKSAMINRQRTALLADGHRGVTLDFGGSAT